MTPQEKAKELFNKYEKKLMYDYNNYHYKYNLEHCKQCALIAVDEILDIGLGFMHDETAWNIEKYWQEVKKEILNL
jgi:hypothetical protein